MVRHGQGPTARTERLETDVGGLTDRTTAAPEGTPEQGCQANRRDFQAHPSPGVVVRQWQGTDAGPGGHTVLLTQAPVEQPWRVCDDEDDRRLIEACWIKEATPPWELGHPPQKHARAVRVPVGFTRLRFALTPASRLPRQARGDEPPRDQVLVWAHGSSAIFCHLSARRILAPVRSKAPRGAARKRQPPAGLGSIRAPYTELIVMSEPQYPHNAGKLAGREE